VSFLTPVWSYVDALVHPAAQQDALTLARHRAFIAPRLLGSLGAIASLPVYIVGRGVPTTLEVGIFSCCAVPILIAYYLSRTDLYERAHLLSSVSVAALVIPVAACTGGITSFAAIWLALVPLEAAFSASRRVIALATIFALVAAGTLATLSVIHVLPQSMIEPRYHGALVAFAIFAATLYGAGLALSVDLLVRTCQASLHAADNRYRLLAASTSDVIVRHDQNGSVMFVSPSAEMLVGGPANVLLGNGLFERVHVADRPAYLTALADVASEHDERLVEFRLCRDLQAERSMQFLWVEMRCRPRDFLSGKKTAPRNEIVAVLRDISEQKSQSRPIEIALSESEEANAAKVRFIATMGHELRTPLDAIIGFSDNLRNDTLKLDASRKTEYARLINDSGHHLLSVVDGLLDASRMSTGNFEISPESFVPTPEIKSCANLLALKAREAGVELKLDMGSDLPAVMADRPVFNQILINLISNAIKFTPRDGQVVVTASRERARLVVTVEDNGIGIDENDLPRLGEALFQASATREHRRDGSGLGLSIVKSLAHLHGGDVAIQSRIGEGKRVTVRLPFEGGSGTSTGNLIKFVPERARGIAMTANIQVKKSA
jgi:two-component system, cell cycle sensor histidine kinase DivJ